MHRLILFYCYSCVLLQMQCARVLLFRGADKTVRNSANKDAAELAVISENLDLAHLITNFDSSQAR